SLPDALAIFDEYVIKSLIDQEALIDIYGVGTSLVTGKPDAVLDGVYKLSYFQETPRIKLSESLSKTTLPGIKQVHRAFNGDNLFAGADVVALADEQKIPARSHPFEAGKTMSLQTYRLEPLLHKVMEDGRMIEEPVPLDEIASYARERLALLPPEYKRFEFPQVYKVGLSPELAKLRGHMGIEPKQAMT